MDPVEQQERASIEAPAPISGAAFIPLMGTSDGKRGQAPRVVIAWAIVDEDAVERLGEYSWHLTDTGYAGRWTGPRGRRYRVRMHRQILQLAQGDHRQGDHLNRDRLDNRRANLRIVDSDAENRQNVPARGGSSLHRGVSFDKERGKWQAQARVKGRPAYRERFDTEEEAAAAARAWREQHMPFARD